MNLKPFWVALQFFTLLPTPHLKQIDNKDLADSVLWYPLVGAVIGAILWALAALLMPWFSSLVVAGIVLLAWVAITGALHLDGLADCADAWMGGFGSKERTLEIMKDPVSGPIAVCVLMTCLLLKFALIESLLSSGFVFGLMVIPVIGRLSAVLLLLTTEYVREGGLGDALSQQLDASKAWGIVIVLALVTLVIQPVLALCLFTVSLVVFMAWRQRMIQRIDGCTGDTLGAMIELVELAALFGVALFIGFTG
ncbi:adenosylcobinamide-GDP ribazoletransferase [Litoribrevibacter euphylliae]|uniref:Adenosylcobinamide-GDP ribazoletransferase n=1 Tax=Litoribrevibacter euphylliae TaxID=1834034 RepID=A0ABV7HB23_9GAMM